MVYCENAAHDFEASAIVRSERNCQARRHEPGKPPHRGTHTGWRPLRIPPLDGHHLKHPATDRPGAGARLTPTHPPHRASSGLTWLGQAGECRHAATELIAAGPCMETPAWTPTHPPYRASSGLTGLGQAGECRYGRPPVAAAPRCLVCPPQPSARRRQHVLSLGTVAQCPN